MKITKIDGERPMHLTKCPVIRALEIVGGKWRLPIMWELSVRKSMRYNELKRQIPGITNIMLTRALQGLESHGLVSRRALRHIPPHVDYALTDSCKALLPALEIINEWGKKQMNPVISAGCRMRRELGQMGEGPMDRVGKGKKSMGKME